MGSHPASQIGRDAAISAPIAWASCSAIFEVLLPLDPAADGDDALGLRQVDRLLRFLERRLWLLPNRRRVDRWLTRADRRRGEPLLGGISAERADLKRYEMRRRSLGDDIRDQLALKYRARVDEPLAVLGRSR